MYASPEVVPAQYAYPAAYPVYEQEAPENSDWSNAMMAIILGEVSKNLAAVELQFCKNQFLENPRQFASFAKKVWNYVSGKFIWIIVQRLQTDSKNTSSLANFRFDTAEKELSEVGDAGDF